MCKELSGVGLTFAKSAFAYFATFLLLLFLGFELSPLHLLSRHHTI
jgi:hypothetical protein